MTQPAPTPTSNVVPIRPEPGGTAEGAMPPHDLDAEAAVLSACMLTMSAFLRVHGSITPAHFYGAGHARIFEAMIAIHARDPNEPIDVVTVGGQLRESQRLAQVGGHAELTRILNAAPALTPAAVDAYARVIRETARVRELIATTQRISAMGYIDHGDHAAFCTESERAIVEVVRRGREATPRTNLEALKAIVAACTKQSEAAARGDAGRVVSGMPTGIATYDRMTNGLHGTEVTVIGARPGVGKTAIALQISANLAGPRLRPDGTPGRPPIGVGYFQLDNMTLDECLNRILCARALVDNTAMKLGNLDADGWNRVAGVSDQIARWPLVIDDRKRVNVHELRTRAHRLVGDPRFGGVPLGLIVIDYFQKIRPTPARVGTRKHEYLGEAAEEIGHLAGELKIPIILLAQLSRDFEKRGDDPQMSDISDCGEMEKEAQVVSFLVAPAGKKRRGGAGPLPPNAAKASSADDVRTWILQKQRSGRRSGRVNLEFSGAQSRFRDLDAEDAPAWVQRGMGLGDGLPPEPHDEIDADL